MHSSAAQNRRSPAKPRKLNERRLFSRYLLAVIAIVAVIPLAASGLRRDDRPKEIHSASFKTPHVMLPVPADDIARGERISEADFTMISWPADQLSGRYLKEVSAYPGARARMKLPRLLPVPFSAISSRDEETNIVTERIPRGMRAITVRVDAESAVEGWARSGSYVDVIVIQPAALAADGLEAKVIAENVRILSADRRVEVSAVEGAEAPATVTLLVTQENALRIKTAQTVGKLTFALRGTDDLSPALSVSYDAQLISGQKPLDKSYIRGSAKGPDGKVYYLDNNNVWTQKRSGRELE